MTTGPMDCNELVELVSAYLDGSLDLEQRARFDVHLLECDGCENYLQQFRSTVSHPRQDSVRRAGAGISESVDRTRSRDWR